ncbi:MAG: AtpZ/AtpI family protein [Smithellaceae bacterium]|nr:AtpZ/AtpI family protein [Smithellaceae bacterium]
MDRDTKRSLMQIAQLSSVGIGMAIAIFGSLFLGVYLDGKLGTGYLLTILLLLMGIIAGFRNFFRQVKRYGEDKGTLNIDGKYDRDRTRKED